MPTEKSQAKDDLYFDDCPLCQALKRADEEHRSLSMRETIAAFEECKNVPGAYVGIMDDLGEEWK